MRFALDDDVVTVAATTAPSLTDGQEKATNISITVRCLNPTLAKKLDAVAQAERALVDQMAADIKLLMNRVGKPRNLEALIKKVPDLLEHKRIKEMLGYTLNPQSERINQVSRAMSGEAMMAWF
ncbi:hypothetical protein D3C71_1684350 [compost metagenome]